VANVKSAPPGVLKNVAVLLHRGSAIQLTTVAKKNTHDRHVTPEWI